MIPVEPVEKIDFVNDFLERTGYGYNDLLAFSRETNTFLMKNGGKYKLVGNEVEHLAGPSPDPSERI